LKYKIHILTSVLLVCAQVAAAGGEAAEKPNPLQSVVLELLARNGIERRMKVPECVVSNKLDGVVVHSLDAVRTTLWIGEPAHGGKAAWSAGLYTLSKGEMEVELRFFNHGETALKLPEWAYGCGTNIAAGTAMAFRQQWLPVHTNAMPASISVPPPEKTAAGFVKSAIGYRRKGDGAKASKALRMALAAEPLDAWSVVERTFLEDDGEGAVEALIRGRANPALHLESVCRAYVGEKAFKEAVILLDQSSGYEVLGDTGKLKSEVRALQSANLGKESSK
jgi:hypothetical protein